MLLRIGKRKTSCELTDASEFCRVELSTRFGEPDLRLSVYEIEAGDVARAHAEHYAAANLDPPRGALDFDMGGLYQGKPRSGDAGIGFSFTWEAHRELWFRREQELQHFARGLLAEIDSRSIRVTKDEMKRYVGRCVAEGDDEWLSYFASAPNGAGWKKWVLSGTS